MQRKTYRNRWLRQRGLYERMATTRFHKNIRENLFRLPFDDFTRFNYAALVNAFISAQMIVDAFAVVYTDVGIKHGLKIGRAITKEAKEFNPQTFEDQYAQFISDWIQDNLGEKITSIRQTLIAEILRIIADAFSRNDGTAGTSPTRSVPNIAAEIKKKVKSKDFYLWQAKRIARTETTAAANLGAIMAANDHDVELEKEWISTIDKKTRRKPQDEYDHLFMDGNTVDLRDDFLVDGENLHYPGDPRGSAGNVINCRCTIAVLVKRDSEGRIIFKN